MSLFLNGKFCSFMDGVKNKTRLETCLCEFEFEIWIKGEWIY